ncbi:hypothetical protein [Alkaliphilus sp. B6464]|uniref:hypothetical protein n=1 Tax=Alkaliphilus sp. B6464 TaxID=2731219 RepID=UPI001BA94333|nr:hypothetical protein [Alkaliphilus sp. B6464]QUH21740.1 hypothetical protein HYG84_17545 [Alkaliphilus sp. B6464]
MGELLTLKDALETIYKIEETGEDLMGLLLSSMEKIDKKEINMIIPGNPEALFEFFYEKDDKIASYNEDASILSIYKDIDKFQFREILDMITQQEFFSYEVKFVLLNK